MRIFEQRACTTASAVALGCFMSATAVAADETSTPAAGSGASLQLEEVVVTARKREESLQNVPDAITAFTATTITDFGIEHVGDFAALTPNLTFQDGSAFRSGLINLSMRGIGNGQEGWPSVSYIVDGVPADSTDSINSGSLEDIERIEVLRGPQSALYGFNAIAGAINVITKRPTNDWVYEARALYGNGDDRQIGATVSGPIIPDTLLFRLSVSYRDDDGLIRSSSNGLDLDFKDQKQVQSRLIFKPIDNLEIDLHGDFDQEHNGSTYQDKLPSEAYIDNFNSAYDARRGFAGYDDRTLYRFAARIQWDFEPVSLISITGFDHIDQHLDSSVCYDDPSDPLLPAPGGGAQCLFGTAYGNAAAPGQPIDNFFDSLDNFRTLTEDLRVASRGNDTLQWTVGASTLHRKYLAGFDAGLILAPDRNYMSLYPAWNDKKDDWWGLYGQLIWKVTHQLELTAAARYDDETYRNTSFTDRTLATVVPVFDKNGNLEDTQKETADAFQPKGQASWRFTDDVMGYATVSRGFRAGYFNTGAFTLPEHTTNYELGLKSTFWDRRIIANAAVFHIDYSNQQFSTIIAQFPFRIAVTIPKTSINGAEYESTLLASRFVSFGLGLGYLNAVVADSGGQSPAAPRFNGNASADFTYPLVQDWKARLHVDDRYNSLQYLSTGDTQAVPAKNFVNLRAGVQSDHYDIAAFVRNATNERQAAIAGTPNFTGGYIRDQNEPRSYGIEVRASF